MRPNAVLALRRLGRLRRIVQEAHLDQRLAVEAEQPVLFEVERERERAQQAVREQLHLREVVEQRLAPARQPVRPLVALVKAVAGGDVGIVARVFVLVLERLVDVGASVSA